jgi:hypothetical protein
MGAPPRSLPPRRPRLRWPVGPTSRNPDPSRAGLAEPDTHAGDRDDPPAPRGYDGDAGEPPERLAGALPPGTASSNTPARGRRSDTRRKARCISRNLPTDDRPRVPRRRPVCWPPEARCGIVSASARPRDQGGRERQTLGLPPFVPPVAAALPARRHLGNFLANPASGFYGSERPVTPKRLESPQETREVTQRSAPDPWQGTRRETPGQVVSKPKHKSTLRGRKPHSAEEALVNVTAFIASATKPGEKRDGLIESLVAIRDALEAPPA